MHMQQMFPEVTNIFVSATVFAQPYLSNPMTGCKDPAARTSFLMLGDEWTRFPITPT